MTVTSEEGGGGGKEPRVEPKFGAINAMLRPGGEVDEAAKAQQEAMSKLGAAFKKIEKEFHGNRQAVSIIRKLDKMSKDKRDDLIRTLEPMLVERGYTLEVIDPEDLAAQAKANPPTNVEDEDEGEGEGDDQDDDRSAVAPSAPLPIADALTAARDRFKGAVESTATTKPVSRGSTQLRKLIGAIRTGESVTEAALYAGMDLGEAQEHHAAEKRGEYADIVPITPGGKTRAGGKPKLGIVTGGSN